MRLFVAFILGVTLGYTVAAGSRMSDTMLAFSYLILLWSALGVYAMRPIPRHARPPQAGRNVRLAPPRAESNGYVKYPSDQGI